VKNLILYFDFAQSKRPKFLSPGALLPGETEQDRLERRLLLSQLAQSYKGHLSALIESDSAKARLNQLRNESKSWQGFPHGPPFPSFRPMPFAKLLGLRI